MQIKEGQAWFKVVPLKPLFYLYVKDFAVLKIIILVLGLLLLQQKYTRHFCKENNQILNF